jgi:small subunit ribosomal protein S17e
MGRIKSKIVKRTTKSLLKEDNSVFTGMFDENKNSLRNIGLTPSKKVRNQIAGYITRIRKKENSRK